MCGEGAFLCKMPAGAGAFSKGGFYAEGSSIWKGRYRKVYSDFQPGGGVCGHGKKSDPKADSNINLLGGEPLRPVMNYMREEDEEPEKLEDISKEGFGGVLCIETGGPTPGLGCAGRGIIATFQLLEDLKLFETWKPDVVLYDVLGDVVCGGFAAPIREGYAEKVLIVTSGEKMALYAANNISSAVRNFEDRSYARIFGIVLNHRNVENETEKVQAFAEKSNIPIVGEIPRSDEIIRWEDQGKTVIEGDENSEISEKFFALARKLLESEGTVQEKEDV